MLQRTFCIKERLLTVIICTMVLLLFSDIKLISSHFSHLYLLINITHTQKKRKGLVVGNNFFLAILKVFPISTVKQQRLFNILFGNIQRKLILS